MQNKDNCEEIFKKYDLEILEIQFKIIVIIVSINVLPRKPGD